MEEVRLSLSRGRKVHVFAVYTRRRDVTMRLERILQREGIRVAVLTSDVKPEVREAWYERQSRQGVQVVISHPKLVSLGLDLLEYKDLIFWETGYSLYTLWQASRRSWRIGQTEEVTVKYFAYRATTQETCLRLMGRKLLVALGMEGKFSADSRRAGGRFSRCGQGRRQHQEDAPTSPRCTWERLLVRIPHGHYQTRTLIAGIRLEGHCALWLFRGSMNSEMSLA